MPTSTSIIQTPANPSTTPKTYGRANTYAALYTLESGDNLTTSVIPTAQGSRIIINFPAMPELLELARSAVYRNFSESPITPDGYHIYQHTEPMEVPIRFSISARDDDYCNGDGPLALLQTAASLQALQNPIRTGSQSANLGLGSAASVADNSQGNFTESQLQNGSSVGVGNTGVTLSSTTATAPFLFPPACCMNIILASWNGRQLALQMTGFVRRVGTTFRGPWLQGKFQSGGGGLQNMPSFLDCDFVFVNQPGYSNNFAAPFVMTSAKDVWQNLFDVATLPSSSNVQAIGVNGPSAPSPLPPSANSSQIVPAISP